MLNQRQKEIVEFLSEVRHAKTEALADYFRVSQETIRRDLLELERSHSVKRVRGGAVYNNYRARETEYHKKLESNYEEKKAIAKLAASAVDDGDAIAIGNGASGMAFAEYLAGHRQNLTVITNSPDIASVLNEVESNTVYLPGGLLRKHNRSIVGTLSIRFLEQFKVDKTIVSVDGVSLAHGVMEYNVEEAATIRALLQIAHTKILLCEYRKFSEVALTKVCDAQEIDLIFTDWHMSAKDSKQWEKAGIRIMQVKQKHRS